MLCAMDLRQLEYFVAVAQERSFTRAAARLDAVQSTVSAGVAALERELRCVLFVRSTRRVSLTTTGAELLPYAQQILTTGRQMSAVAADAHGGLRGRIRMGTLTNLSRLDLPTRLGVFQHRYPAVQLSMVQRPRGSSDIVRDLRAGRLDVGLLGLSTVGLEDLDPIVLLDVPFVAVLPIGHPLASEEQVRLQDLVDERFVDVPKGFGNRLVVDDWLSAHQLRRQVHLEVPDLSLIPNYVAAGLGIAVVPEQPDPSLTGLAVRPLIPELRWQLCVASAPESRALPAVQALLAELRRTDS